MGCGSSSKQVTPIPSAPTIGKKIQPSPPPPSILRELFNDIAANIVDAVDQEGRATTKGLVALIQEVSLISGMPIEQLPKPSQLDEVRYYEDKNKGLMIIFCFFRLSFE
jgi:hypothetical protein